MTEQLVSRGYKESQRLGELTDTVDGGKDLPADFAKQDLTHIHDTVCEMSADELSNEVSQTYRLVGAAA